MKNTNECPKCRSNKIIVIPGSTGAYGVGHNIPVGRTVFSYAKVNRYLCSDCGYSEEWVAKEDIERIAKKYDKR